MSSVGDRLFELFKEVPDAYPDFVRFVPSIAESEGVADDLLDYMENSPELTTSDILEWIANKSGWDYT